MASAKQFPLALIVKAVDKATAPLRKINTEVGGLQKAAKAASKAGLYISAGVTAPLTAMAVTSVSAFSRFQEGMSNVATLVDTNVESIDEMGKTIVEMGRRIPVPIEQLVEGLTEARSAGVSAADQFSVLEGSAKLAMVGLGQTKEAVDIVTSAMNAFNLKGKDSERIYNAVFQATNVGKASISDLAQGFGSVAGTVSAAGVRLEEYMASVAALTTTGLPASEAHRQLRAVIAGLTREGKLTSAVFRHLGAKDFNDLIAKSGGLVPALNRITTAVRGNKKQMLEMLGSTNAFNAVLGLTGNQAEAFREALALMDEGGDTFERKFIEKTQTFQAQQQRMSNAVMALRVSVGGILVSALEQIIPIVTRLADAWGNLSPATQKAAVVFGALAAALGPAAVTFSAFATVVGTGAQIAAGLAGWTKYLWMMRASIMAGLIPSLKAAIASSWAFTASLLANPIVWLAAAIGGAAFLIYRNWNQITLFFRFLWDDVSEIFSKAWVWFQEHMSWHPVALIVKHWGPIKGFFSGLWEGVVGAFQWAKENIKAILGWIGKLVASSPVFKAVSAIARFAKTGLAGDSSNIGSGSPPTIGAESAAPAAGVRSTEARVVVDFSNMPKGTRVTQDPQSSTPMDLSLGYSMVGP